MFIITDKSHVNYIWVFVILISLGQLIQMKLPKLCTIYDKWYYILNLIYKVNSK